MDALHVNDPAFALSAALNTSARVSVGASSHIFVYNNGTAMAYVRVGDVTVVATTSDAPVPPNTGISFRKTKDQTHLAGISTAALALVGQAGTGV